MFSRGYDRLPEGEFHSVQLSRHQDAGVEIANHADGLELLEESVFVRRNVQARDRANFRVAERRDHGTQIIGPNTNVAVVDDQHFVLRFAYEARELHHFVVGRGMAGDVDDANAPLRKIALQLFDDFQDGFVTVADAEEKFVVGIILIAVAGEIFVGLGIQAANWLEIAYGRRVLRRRARFSSAAEKLPRTVKREEIVDERNGGDAEKNVNEVTRRH